MAHGNEGHGGDHGHVHPHHGANGHEHPHHGATLDDASAGARGDPSGLISRRGLLKASGFGLAAWLVASADAHTQGRAGAATSGATKVTLPGFEKFATTVTTLASGEYWLVESDGIPSHAMMVGITNWQQQVPTPQPYTGSNAWSIPRHPVYATSPVSLENNLQRGAIALSVDGIPIFNALDNQGRDAYLTGQLDHWGGHSGRADDYHLHIAPLYLQSVVGVAQPIAYALDGYQLFGSKEPDGSPMRTLDKYHGHVFKGSYHYHGTMKYPYTCGSMRGVVHVGAGQINPQSVTTPFRPSGTPLPGAVITGFDRPSANSFVLEYTLGGQTYQIAYQVVGTTVNFQFTDPTGAVVTETYSRATPPVPASTTTTSLTTTT